MNAAQAVTRTDRAGLAMRLAPAVLACVVVGLSIGIGGTGGLVYLAVYLLVAVPGLPIGFAVFGQGHAAGWVAGVLAGYALTSIVISALIHFGYDSFPQLASAWAALTIGAWSAFALRRRGRSPTVTLPSWTQRDTTALCLVALLAPALCGAPFLKVGARDPDGTRAYRAYFTMDFFWHTALTAEVSKFSSPPRNPYWATEPLHYYWSYFAVPAAVVGHAPATLPIDVAPTLLINALCTSVLLIAMVFLAAWCVVPRASPVALAVVLVTVAASAEGAYALLDLIRRGRSLQAVRDLNIDAVTAWSFRGLRVDSLPRSFWWVPQHGTACALGLVALLATAAEGAAARPGAIAFAGCALGASLVMSPFLGAAFSLVFGVAVVLDAVRLRQAIVVRLLRHAAAALPVVVALAWCVHSGVLEGAPGAMKIGWGGLARHSPVSVLFLSVGPALLPALAGLWPVWRLPRTASAAVAGLAVGLFLLFFVWIPLDTAYVGFRAGQVILVTLPGLVAVAFSRSVASRARRLALTAIVVVLIAIGLPTTVIDWYNAQDTTNRRMGPGFRWTVTVTPQEQQAFNWIRRATDPRATVQMEPTSRGRDTWTLIPTFAQRRMAAGLAFPLLQRPEFAERSGRVRRMYENVNAEEAWQIARELGVDYVYLDRTERAKFPAAALAKFDAHPEYFRPVFVNDEVRIYGVVSSPR